MKKNKTTKPLSGGLSAIKEEKIKAYKRVKDLSSYLLTRGSSYAFELIFQAFDRYKKLQLAEEAYLRRNAKEYYHALYILMTCRTIKDVYFELEQPIQLLWDAVPELKSWKEQYR